MASKPGSQRHFHCLHGQLDWIFECINAVFPQTDIQNCIIHQLRNSSKYVSYKDLKVIITDLKAVYAAVDEPSAQSALDVFEDAWGKEISPDRCFLAGELSKPEHIFQIPERGSPVDLHDQCH